MEKALEIVSKEAPIERAFWRCTISKTIRNYIPEEKVSILRRHLVENVAITV